MGLENLVTMSLSDTAVYAELKIHLRLLNYIVTELYNLNYM